MKKMSLKNLLVLNSEQKKQFFASIPDKVFKTERNISYIVAMTQLCMIILFFMKKETTFDSSRGIQYFSLYVALLISTVLAIYFYSYTKSNHHLRAFLMVRRIYAIVLCIWVLCITYLETMTGKGITVYCYLMPTMGALLLMTPIEGCILYGGVGIALISSFLLGDHSKSLFGNVVNSIFVTILTLFVSYRYYRSMAIEFCNHEIISSQYKEIEESNTLLQKLVQIDQLTNLFNRHYLIEKLYPLFAEQRREDKYGMFLMMDIDYFKQFNDTYGHVEGDECLKKLASVLLAICKQYEVEPIRFGGEEFLLIKLSSHEIDASVFAEKVQEQIHDMYIKREDIEFDRVSVSIGLWNGKLCNVPHIESAIKRADDALYEAKKQGRNRIIEV